MEEAHAVVYKAFVGRRGIQAMAPGDAARTPGKKGKPGRTPTRPPPAMTPPVQPVLRGITSKSIAARRVTFHGCCYYCGYEAHSQMYCPLRWCKVCRHYGHSEAVCSKLRPSREEEEEDDGEWD